ncbi:hypothetical protein WJX81_002356 [Elliptochloris bilobata]|uniref:Uncharacterized protein n=1 Tax=Elliptochloris bilobata TaxID=381761 RepID=A0AAW1SH70_9CHLO
MVAVSAAPRLTATELSTAGALPRTARSGPEGRPVVNPAPCSGLPRRLPQPPVQVSRKPACRWPAGGGTHHGPGDDGGAAAAAVRVPAHVRALGGNRVMHIAAGLAHTAACCDAGGAYAWGWNADGQLGTGDDQGRNAPTLLEAGLADEHVIKVACGARHTLALTQRGVAFATGWNRFGQLGVGRSDRASRHEAARVVGPWIPRATHG